MKALGTWLRAKPTGQEQPRVRTRGEQKGRYMIVIAGIILAVGACFSAEVLWFLKDCVTKPSVVVENRKSVVKLRGKDTDIFHVVVEFSDDAGVRYELEHGENLAAVAVSERQLRSTLIPGRPDVCCEHGFSICECAYQHQQGGLGQMKIGEQSPDHAELVAR